MAQGEKAGADRGNCKAVKDQSRGVIGETLSFEDDEEPARETQAACDGERRDHVGRRHNGAEHEGDGMPSSQCPTAATAQVVNTTQPNANSVIGRKLKRNSRQLMATPAE